jgi:predicted N-acetyltransferase YhbS
MSDHSASDVSGDVAIRAYEAADFDAIVGLIGAAFGGETPDSVRFAVTAPDTTTFVAERDGHVVGVSMAIVFGATAWIGNVVVAQDWRRRGLGTALTEITCEAAHEEADTVLLLALGDAQRIYARLGFEPDGLYGTWRATDATAERVDAGRILDAGLRLIPASDGPGLAEQGMALDRWATGEDRRAYLELFAPSMKVAVRRGADGVETVAGYSTRTPWRTGAVVAGDAGTARAVLCDLLREAPGTRLEFPDANDAGVLVAGELGLERFKENLRMRLGPPVAGFRPQGVFKALSPAVG